MPLPWKQDPEADERTLLRRYRDDPSGEDGLCAASDLLGRYRRRVYLWCFRFVREHEQALDLAQEALLKAFRALDSHDGRADFGAWLFVVTRNRCLDELRRPSLATDALTDPEFLHSPNPDPEAELLDRLDEEAFLALVNEHLDRDERTALWLRCFEKTPVDEITSLLDLQETSGARGLLQRARRKLSRALAARGGRDGEVGS